jgi:hypothetical protein
VTFADSLAYYDTELITTVKKVLQCRTLELKYSNKIVAAADNFCLNLNWVKIFVFSNKSGRIQGCYNG